MRWPVWLSLALLSCRSPALAPDPSDRGPARAFTPPFACSASTCVQSHPRLPDDGEWTCIDDGGATVCVGGEPAAGVAPAPPDPGWRCGKRRGRTGDRFGNRICVDPLPDHPSGDRASWECHLVSGPPTRRECTREEKAWRLGRGCDASHPCAPGSECRDTRCTLASQEPNCWLDADCDQGRCRFGRCTEAGR